MATVVSTGVGIAEERTLTPESERERCWGPGPLGLREKA